MLAAMRRASGVIELISVGYRPESELAVSAMAPCVNSLSDMLAAD